MIIDISTTVPVVTDQPPLPPKDELPRENLTAITMDANAEDHDIPLKEECVITPKENSQPIVAPSVDDIVIAPSKGKAPVKGKGEIATCEPPPPYVRGFLKGVEKGKGKAQITISGDAMAQLQLTLGIPPANEEELFRRQTLASQIGGLHPSLYNWLVFARNPTATISPIVIPTNVSVESVAGDASSDRQTIQDQCQPPKCDHGTVKLSIMRDAYIKIAAV